MMTVCLHSGFTQWLEKNVMAVLFLIGHIVSETILFLNSSFIG